MSPNMKGRLGPVIRKAMTRLNVPGVSVGIVLDGDEHYVPSGVTNIEFPLDIDKDTLFQIGSTSKTFTGTALMMLVDEGKVDIDAPVRKYLPKFALPDDSVAKAVQIRHLVTHTSGFVGDYFADLGRGDDAVRKLVGKMRRKTPQLTPLGDVWSYNNAGFYVLGRIVEEISGTRFEDFVSERIFKPLGMENTFWFAEDVITRKTALGHVMKADRSLKIARPWGLTRSANPAGGIVSTAVDQMKYARFHLGDGRAADGTRLLKAASLRRMQRPLAPIGWGMAEKVGVTWLLDSYGGARVVKHGGTVNGHMSEFVMVPSKGFGLTVLTNGQRGHEVGTVVIKWCLEELLGLHQPAPDVVSLSAKAASDYTGRYLMTYGQYVVTAENGGLLLTVEPKKELLEADADFAGQLPPPLPIGFVAKDRAVIQGDWTIGAKVAFLRDKQGNVEWMRYGGRVYKREADA